MQMSMIIPEFLLSERVILAVYCYLLRIVRPVSTKCLINGNIVVLRPYEVCIKAEGVAFGLNLEREEVLGSLEKLAQLDLVDFESQEAFSKIRFKYLVFPSSQDHNKNNISDANADIFFDEFVMNFLEYVRTNLSKKTFVSYESILRVYGKWLGRRRLRELKLTDLEKYKMDKKGLVSDQTINIHIRTCKAALEVAAKWGLIEENPYREVKLIRIPKNITPSLSIEEYLCLRNAIKEGWLRNIVDFAILTGLRLGEIQNLRWIDVDYEHGSITIQSTCEYQVKHGKMRTVPLHAQAFEILQKIERCTEFVFVKDDGSHPSCQYISKKFKAYVREASLPKKIHFHSLRATFASWCANAGVSLYTLQNLMGHSSITVTESYTSPDRERLGNELLKISLPSKI